MRRYEVRMTRRVIEYIGVVVSAESPEAARERATALARGAGTPAPGEDVGEWCDGEYGRAFVRSVDEVDPDTGDG